MDSSDKPIAPDVEWPEIYIPEEGRWARVEKRFQGWLQRHQAWSFIVGLFVVHPVSVLCGAWLMMKVPALWALTFKPFLGPTTWPATAGVSLVLCSALQAENPQDFVILLVAGGFIVGQGLRLFQ